MKRYKDMTDMEKEDFKALCIVIVGGVAYTVVAYKLWMWTVTKSVKKVLMKQHGIYFVEV